jgi:hypothetical protein
MAFKVLTAEHVEQFIDKGWVKLEGAFAHEDALAAQDFLWGEVEARGVNRHDKSTWTQPMVRINENFLTPEFQRCNTKRLADAIEDLIGEGRWSNRIVFGETEQLSGFGWWPVNFSLNSDKPWSVPVQGWHWDGIHFRHRIDSPEQGLLCLCLFSDVDHRGGGTFVVEGSHKVVAKFLERFPDGLELGEAIGKVNREHPYMAELTGMNRPESAGSADLYADSGAAGASDSSAASLEISARERIERFMNREHVDADGFKLRVLETTGGAGDAILCHPFLYHASSQNMIGVPRFMCNRTTPLIERLKLEREHQSEYSPLEISIRRALGGQETAV